jgi:hypothetical protein
MSWGLHHVWMQGTWGSTSSSLHEKQNLCKQKLADKPSDIALLQAGYSCKQQAVVLGLFIWILD